MKNRDDDMAPEYDFSNGVKGRYAGRFCVDPATPPGTTVVLRHAIPEHHLQPGDAGQLLGAADEVLAVEFTIGKREPVRVSVRERSPGTGDDGRGTAGLPAAAGSWSRFLRPPVPLVPAQSRWSLDASPVAAAGVRSSP
jgi:hypothetical protein